MDINANKENDNRLRVLDKEMILDRKTLNGDSKV